MQRAALLRLASDHVVLALDGRESRLRAACQRRHAGWRAWLRRSFTDYNELANAVLKQIDIPMPEIDVGAIPKAPITRRRFAAAATDAKPGS